MCQCVVINCSVKLYALMSLFITPVFPPSFYLNSYGDNLVVRVGLNPALTVWC